MQNDRQKGFLGDRFEGHTAAPTEQLWGNIAGKLDEQGQKKRGIIWWWTAGLAAVLLVTFLGASQLQLFTNETELMHARFIHTEKAQFVEQKEYNPEMSEVASSFNLTEDMTAMTAPVKKKDPKTPHLQKSGPANNEQVEVANKLYSEEKVKKPSKSVKEQDQNKTKSSLTESTATEPMSAEFLSFIPVQDPQKIPVAIQHDFSTLADLSHQPYQSKWEWGIHLNSWHAMRSDIILANTNQELEEPVEATSVSPEIFRANRWVGFGGYLGYNWKPRLRFYTELNLESTRYRIQNDNVSLLDELEPPIESGSVNLLALTLPIGLEFDLIHQPKFKAAIGVSFLNELTIRERNLQVYDLNYAGSETTGVKWLTAYRPGLGLHLNFNYQLTDKMRLQLKPGLRTYFSKDAPSTLNIPNYRLWWGGSLGFVRSF